MQFRSLQTKLVVTFGGCFLTLVAALALYNVIAAQRTEGFVAETSRATLTAMTQELLLKKAQALAMTIEAELEVAMDAGRTIADMLAGIKDPQIQLTLEREQINKMLHGTLQRNPSFLATYTLWEPNVDGQDSRYVNVPGYDTTGRLVTYWSRNAAGEIRQDVVEGYEDASLDANGLRVAEYYLWPREHKQECVIDPYTYAVQGETTWMVSLITPLLVDQTFYGIAGVDMPITFIQKLVEQENAAFYQGAGTIAVVSYRGILAGVSSKPELIGQSIQTWRPEQWQLLLQKTQSGSIASDFNDDVVEVSVPLHIGKSQMTWSVNIMIPTPVVLEAVQELALGVHSRSRQDMFRQLWIAGSIILVAFVVIGIASRRIVAPIIQSVHFARTIAAGDLMASLEVKQQDEIGMLSSALQEMLAKLRQVVSDVKYAAKNVASGSQDMSANAETLSQGANEQAAASEQVSSSMEEMAANIRQNTENSLETEKLAQTAAEDARLSGTTVLQTVQAMQQIAKKIAIIDDISRQTRMLSLNATIEAARAQDYGKGFAVVAAEVRSLAERSQTAAAEIMEVVGSSVAVAEKSGGMLQQLVPHIEHTAELVKEITAASREQDSGTQQINQAVQQLDQVTQQNSATSEELAATAEELAGQAEMLQQAISFFKTDEVDNAVLQKEQCPVTAQPAQKKSSLLTNASAAYQKIRHSIHTDAHEFEFERF